jgi:hypothetical protein
MAEHTLIWEVAARLLRDLGYHCAVIARGRSAVFENESSTAHVLLDHDPVTAADRFWGDGHDHAPGPWPSVQALIASAAFYAATVVLASGGGRATVETGSLIRLALRPPLGPRGRPWAFRGFVRCSDGGIVSLAIADDASRQFVGRAIEGYRPDAPLPLPAAAAARVLQEWGIPCLPARLGPRKQRRLVEAPLPPARPPVSFEGTRLERRIVCLGQLVASPLAASLLAGAGAEVHYLLHPVRPPAIDLHPRVELAPADLATPAGRRALDLLFAPGAVVLDNFTPRVLPGLSLEIPLEVAHVTLPGLNTSNERRNWRSLGFQIEAASGLWPTTGLDLWRAKGPLVSDVAMALIGAGAAALARPPERVTVPQLPVFSSVVRAVLEFAQ